MRCRATGRVFHLYVLLVYLAAAQLWTLLRRKNAANDQNGNRNGKNDADNAADASPPPPQKFSGVPFQDDRSDEVRYLVPFTAAALLR